MQQLGCNGYPARRVAQLRRGGALAPGAFILLALACRNGADAGLVNDPAPALVVAAEEPTGTVPSDGSACAPPREGAHCSGDPTWARNPQTGECCTYSAPCAVPWEWPMFDSESECQTSCRCADVTPSDTSLEATHGAVLATERTSFECVCPDGSCRPTETLAEVLGASCGADGPHSRTMVRGCGMVSIPAMPGYVGTDRVFDRDTGALIGMTRWSDVPMAPCRAHTIVVGREFVCEDATECALCAGDAGVTSGGLPACD